MASASSRQLASVSVVFLLLVAFIVVIVTPNKSRSDDTFATTMQLDTPYNPSSVSTGGSSYGGSTLGQYVKHTLKNWATTPTTASAAEAAGMSKSGDCLPGLGVLYEPKGGTSKDAPLAAYYTPAGQLTGLRITIWGSDSKDTGTFKGPAASAELVRQGYWIESGDFEWQLSVSFRSADDVCSKTKLSSDVGDRVVINQHTIAKSVPMTDEEAKQEKWAPGSCMKGMGQHWAYDISSAPKLSFQSSTLLPIVPMYDVKNGGKINAFFFTTPSCQNDHGPNWDNAGPLGDGLPSAGMCANFCSDKCATGTAAVAANKMFGTTAWSNPSTTCWATFHVFFNPDPQDQPTCPNAASIIGDPLFYMFGRSCDMSRHKCSSWNPFC